MLEFLSKRGKTNVKDLPALVKAHFNALKDLYDPVSNPEGYINMGTAETKLVDGELIELMKKIMDRLHIEPSNLHYNKFHGSDQFRQAIAKHWQKVVFAGREGGSLTKDNIAVTAGCTAALEMLATLLGDEGDVFLIPAPYYSSFTDDINERAGVIPEAVYCTENLEKEVFYRKIKELKAEGKNVRCVLFSSPNNPVGTVYKKEALKNIIDFCMENNLDLISDEIYAETVFDPEAKFISVMSLVPEEYMHRVHVTSSFAKDFALSGFRTGLCISFNREIIRGMENITYFGSVSSITQTILKELLKAPELEELMKLNRQRLRKTCALMKQGLAEIGVVTKKAEAGIFLWADFRPFMNKTEFEEEFVLWEKIYNELKINISPGQLFASEEPGWFRICYADDIRCVQEACRRLASLRKRG
ncbi:MAG: aminotransferase class I/II-fold pyridoxal phosphate-dependent enzyme [Peptostreptococcaceae bacterium]|nr:aminotransferase class I/II-fold pyridoxal phosphate-dependent enzyme [Peptostreptococcaceae bacterium]